MHYTLIHLLLLTSKLPLNNTHQSKTFTSESHPNPFPLAVESLLVASLALGLVALQVRLDLALVILTNIEYHLLSIISTFDY